MQDRPLVPPRTAVFGTRGQRPVRRSGAFFEQTSTSSALAGLLLSMLLAALDSTIVATALPTITTELGSPERLSRVVTAYLLAQTVVIPLYGKLGDLYGRKVVLQTAIVVFLAGSALCGLAGSMAGRSICSN